MAVGFISFACDNRCSNPCATAGWLLLINAKQSFLRLVAALIFAIFFLVAILACSPYRTLADGFLAAGTQLLLICIFIGGILVRLQEELATDIEVPPGLAFSLLGFSSADEAVTMMIVCTVFMLSSLGLSLVLQTFSHRRQMRLDEKWSLCTLEPRERLTDLNLRANILFPATTNWLAWPPHF